MDSDSEAPLDSDPVQVPITGELDLHGFPPQVLGALIPDYLELCRQRGILEVRLIHGKGRGQIRESVHAILRRHPGVIAFSVATPAWGGHGATLVRLDAERAPQTLN
jgi:DNA-nicking Smr family endonuclease